MWKKQEEKKEYPFKYYVCKGDIAALANYLEKGGDPNVKDPNGYHRNQDLLEYVLSGAAAWDSYGFGVPHVKSADEAEKLLLKMAKMLVAAGFEISERDLYYADTGTSVNQVRDHNVHAELFAYLTDIKSGKQARPTEESLRADGIPLSLIKRANYMAKEKYAEEQKAREENGIELNENALRADDVAPDTRVNAPLNVNGRIVYPENKIDL